MAERKRLFGDYIRFRRDKMPSDTSELPVVDEKDQLNNKLTADEGPDGFDLYSKDQLNRFRTISTERKKMYDQYDEMALDSVIANALEMYADDATQYDEKGRIIWVESDDEKIAQAGNRLLKVLQIPERAWKHIYMMCKYGDYYLKLYTKKEFNEEDSPTDEDKKNKLFKKSNQVEVKVKNKETPGLVEYVEDIDDPATVYDLQKRGKTSGFIEVQDVSTVDQTYASMGLSTAQNTYTLEQVNVYDPKMIIHLSLGEMMTRKQEKITLTTGPDGESTTFTVKRGKSALYDVFPVQQELELLEDTLLLNRLTRSALIRILQIEVGDMPKKEVNAYMRRMKNLIEQHISMDKDTGSYRSYQQPGPIDNVIYVPTKNGRGAITVNNLGGDVNVRDIADIDYFSNKRAGVLKIPRAYLGDDMEGSGLSNGGSLTKLDARYARTVKRFQTAYIKGITALINFFFLDKKLDYVNKFTVRMTSPSAQEDIDRGEFVKGQTEVVSSIMSLLESLEGGTQKKILADLMKDIMKMPEIAKYIEDDETPDDEVDIEGEMTGAEFDDVDIPTIDTGSDSSGDEGFADLSSEFEAPSSGSTSGGFTDDEFAEFEDELPQ